MIITLKAIDAAFAVHNKVFEFGMAEYLGTRIKASYRGGQMFDNNTLHGQKLRKIQNVWFSFYKKNRLTIIQPVIHIHPFSETREIGVAIIFNPAN